MNAIVDDFEDLEAPFEQSPGTTPSNESSGSGCDIEVDIAVDQADVSISQYDFGKFTPPGWNEWERVQAITDRLNEINDRMTELSNIAGRNFTEENVNESKSLAAEVKSFGNELNSMGFTVTALVPMPVGPEINVTLSSDPNEHPGTITSDSYNVRAGANNRGLGLGEWKTDGSNEGTTNFSALYVLSGNYGTLIFRGTVTCGGLSYASDNNGTITIDGECKLSAQRSLDTYLNNMKVIVDACKMALNALVGTMAALTIALAVAAAFVPPVIIPAILAAISTLAAAVITAVIDTKWNDTRQDILDTAQPYVDSLPPCP